MCYIPSHFLPSSIVYDPVCFYLDCDFLFAHFWICMPDCLLFGFITSISGFLQKLLTTAKQLNITEFYDSLIGLILPCSMESLYFILCICTKISLNRKKNSEGYYDT